jgi:hypothetical protein
MPLLNFHRGQFDFQALLAERRLLAGLFCPPSFKQGARNGLLRLQRKFKCLRGNCLAREETARIVATRKIGRIHVACSIGFVIKKGLYESAFPFGFT